MSTKKNEQTTTSTNPLHDAIVDNPVSAYWQRSLDEHVARLDTTYQEMSKIQNRSAEQLNSAMDEMTKLWKAQFAYLTQLQDEWRNLAMDATRRSTEMLRQG